MVKESSQKVKELRESLTLASMNPASAVSTQGQRLKPDSIREDRQPLTSPRIESFVIPPVGEREKHNVEPLIVNGAAVRVSAKHKKWCRYCGRLLGRGQGVPVVDHLLRCTKVPREVQIEIATFMR